MTFCRLLAAAAAGSGAVRRRNVEMRAVIRILKPPSLEFQKFDIQLDPACSFVDSHTVHSTPHHTWESVDGAGCKLFRITMWWIIRNFGNSFYLSLSTAASLSFAPR